MKKKDWVKPVVKVQTPIEIVNPPKINKR